MGQVKHAIHGVLDDCDCYQQAADRIEEMGLGTDSEMLREFWNGLFGDEDDKPRAYKLHSHNQFVQDMLNHEDDDIELDVYHYRGRFFYEGPAVDTSDIQVVIRATQVEVQWDNMGLRFVVYPKNG